MGKLLGQALSAARKQKGFKQDEVAKAVGVSRAAVGQWESGATEPSTANLIAACDFLGLNISAATSGMVKFIPMPNVNPVSGSKFLDNQPEDATIQFVRDRRPEFREFEDEVGSLIGTGVESRLMPRDVPVYGVVYGGSDGDFIMNGEIIDYVRRPPGIHAAKGVYAVFVTGTSMSPRYDQGDIVFVNPNRAPSVGDDAIVQIHSDGREGEMRGFLKRLVRRSQLTTTFEQFNPHGELEIENASIKAVHRVVPLKELLAV